MEKFYVYNKKKIIANELLSLKQKIENNSIKESETDQALTLFSEENNAFAGISNIYGIPQYGFNGKNNVSTIEIKDDKNQLYKIYIDGFLNKAGFIEKLEESKSIEVEGDILESNKNEVYPNRIMIDGKAFLIPKITFLLLEDTTLFNINMNSSDDINIMPPHISNDKKKIGQ